MNRKITAIVLTGLLSSCSFVALAAEKTAAGSPAPTTSAPGSNQARGAESKEDKASKKGEEASGSNSGADAEMMEKDMDTSSGKKDGASTQQGNKP
ncbi:hypothetical protein [Pseudomonas sp. NA-150]|uniref:hypothetical protein n=1 Tax=Pseudomonas sp. NA-150 TaxID=3367525 RepID=UPI0037C6E13F